MPTTTNPNSLRQAGLLGQSIWYDNIRRGLIASGELQTLIDQGIVGITSNPTIFEKAISGSTDYDSALRPLVARGLPTAEIYEALAVEDIRGACDLLLPVFESSAGVDGRVSLEVLPALSANTEQTISEGIRLARLVGRPNVMIKVPATSEGLPAVTALIAAGVSVNVTLIFSLDQYRQVWDAYVDGIEKRAAAGGRVDDVASVASFFVSRVDSACDKQLDEKIESGAAADRARAQGLLGKIAIANAKLAYEMFEKATAGARWKAAAARGARPQRLLWASTGTKDPRYPDTLYLDGLIGADTVNTVPPATLAAFLDHGQPTTATLSSGLSDARAQIAALADLGIDLDGICRALLADGVKSFRSSMDNLLGVIAARRAALGESASGRQAATLSASDRAAVDAAVAKLTDNKAPQRIWGADPTVFTPDPAHEKSIRNRLGWLRVAELMQGNVADLRTFVAEVRAAGFKNAVLLGMGGSSLGPEVLSHTFREQPGADGLALQVLDNTDPAAVRAVEKQAGDLRTTLFVVASKSGGTIEIQAFERYFWDRVSALHGGDVARTGAQFIAITDPSTHLGQLAADKHYRRAFINPADIGGRYSVLSYFGLVPAALLGLDVAALVERGAAMALASSSQLPARDIVSLELGAIMGTMAARGRDKMTLVSDPEIETLGSWVEQLVAESTGKEGKGIVPVDLEPLGPPEVYGSDRLFVRTSLAGAAKTPAAAARAAEEDKAVAALERAGHPVVRLVMPAREDLGREFFRWEFATAVAGMVMGVNPFDEPNVTEAKLATGALLTLQRQEGKLPPAEGVVTPADADAIRAHVFGAKPGDYVAFCAYFLRNDRRDDLLARLRVAARARTKAATTLGYGPRFLHSTGQLHKGGPNNGVFIQLTADAAADLAIPGETYSFAELRDAQALGDLQVLRRRGRRALRVSLGSDIDGGLEQLLAALTSA